MTAPRIDATTRPDALAKEADARLSDETVPTQHEIAVMQEKRGLRYGRWYDNSATSQALCNILRDAMADNVNILAPQQIEALEMAMHKVARIVCGDPAYLDSWRDAESYLNLGRQWTQKHGGGYD